MKAAFVLASFVLMICSVACWENQDEARARVVVEAFMMAGASGDVEAAKGQMINEYFNSSVEELLSCDPALFDGFVSYQATSVKIKDLDDIRFRGHLIYEPVIPQVLKDPTQGLLGSRSDGFYFCND